MDSPEFLRLADDFGWHIESLADARGGWWVIVGERPPSTFDEEILDELADVVDGSWWYEVRNSLLVDYMATCGVPRSLWEVGAGTGIVAQALQNDGYQVVAVEPGRSGAAQTAERGVPSIASTLEELRLPAGSIPAIGLFDVIEHLEDPGRFLEECRRVLDPAGQLVVTVPAYSWLWSNADDLAGHWRRYTTGSLIAEVEDSGFDVRDCSYRMASLVGPMFFARAIPYRLGHRSEPSAVQRQLAISTGGVGRLVTVFERRAGRYLPFGTSVFAVAAPNTSGG